MQSETVADNPAVQNELKPGEHLLWWGKPDPAHRMKNNTAIYVTGIFLGVLSVFSFALTVNAWNLLTEEIDFSTGLQAFTFFLFIFCVFLCVFCVLRLLLFYNQIQKSITNLRNTTYAITDQRIFVMTASKHNFAVKSHTRSDIGQIVRVETGAGWGDVSYGIPRTQHAGFRNITVVDKLAGVPNAWMVEDILLRTFKRNPQPQQNWYPAQTPPMPQPPTYPPQPQYYMQQPYEQRTSEAAMPPIPPAPEG